MAESFWGGVGAAGITGIINGIATWLMSDSDDEEKRRELDAQLDREQRRLPPWAYARLKSLLTGSVTPSGTGGGAGAAPGAFQRVLGGGGGMGAPRAPGGMAPRLSPQMGAMGSPQRNPQLRTFLGQ